MMAAIAAGAEILRSGGSALDGPEYNGGYFVQPTVYAEVRPEMRIAQEEIFGPVVGIIPADDADEAIAIANNVRYGLSASLFTRDITQSFRFIGAMQAGIIHVNGETAGRSLPPQRSRKDSNRAFPPRPCCKTGSSRP